jgi:uncharacterized protein
MSLQDQLPPAEEPVSTATVASPSVSDIATAGPTANDKTMGMLAHLLGIFLGPVGALIIWLTQKDTSPWAGDEAKEALNFQITMLIGWFVAGALAAILIGLLLLPVVGIVSLIFSIMGAMEANKGNHYKYPFALRLIQ